MIDWMTNWLIDLIWLIDWIKFDLFSNGEEKYKYSGKYEKDALTEWLKKWVSMIFLS